ncbi:MAG: pyroglutamyl-peptidase I family protein [Planctomycetaceae bacterium]
MASRLQRSPLRRASTMLLLTGFEPFGGLSRNPSGEIARALEGEGVQAALLPVDYARVGTALAGLLDRSWEAVLLMGVAIGRPRLSLERVALNYRDPGRPDNAGRTPERAEVVPGGPAAYFATLPLESLSAALAAAGHPVEISLSAGAYLCNAAFYLARHALDARGIPCGFLHLPPTPDLACGAEPMPFERQLEAVRLLLGSLRARGASV